MKCGVKVIFGVGSIEGNDDLHLLLIMDYVESRGDKDIETVFTNVVMWGRIEWYDCSKHHSEQRE